MELAQRRAVPQPLSLYLHIPFCHFKCYYCDFNTYAGIEPLLPLYVDALSTELRRWGQALSRPSGLAIPSPLRGKGEDEGEAQDFSPGLKRKVAHSVKAPVATVFLGGGTPSLLTPSQLERILTTVADHFALQPNAEITLEANPESVTADKMRSYRVLGINRVSMGAQSFDDSELKMLGRLADSARVVAAYAELRTAGLDNVNLDLIYGLPGQAQETWSRTLSEALALAPEHLSLYALTVEEHTPFHRWVQEGTLPLPDPDLAADMYEEACDRLEAAGYQQYEISNWARPGRACRHNLVYWRNGPFIGAGPGAHSFLPGARFAILSQPREYIAAIARLQKNGPPPPLTLNRDLVGAQRAAPRAEGNRLRLTTADVLKAIAPVDSFDPISDDLEHAETLILGLRLNEGVSLDGYAARYGRSPLDLYGPQIEESIADGLLELVSSTTSPSTGEGLGGSETVAVDHAVSDSLTRGGVLRLTPRGRLLANEVFVRILRRP